LTDPVQYNGRAHNWTVSSPFPEMHDIGNTLIV
jgi:hypothetical protein